MSTTVPAMRAIRQTIVKRLRDDAALAALLGGPNRIFHRMRKQPMEARSVSYFDFGRKPDRTVPLRDRTFQLDVWDTSPERAANVADRIEAVLDPEGKGRGAAFGVVGGGTANIVYIGLIRDSDVVADDGDLVKATLEYQVLAYKLA